METELRVGLGFTIVSSEDTASADPKPQSKRSEKKRK
jgi:hypothetical protein